MNDFLASNETPWRLARTIVQGILGVVIANLDIIAGAYILDPAQRAIVVALVMAVLSPVMAEIGVASAPVEGAHAKDTGSNGLH